MNTLRLTRFGSYILLAGSAVTILVNEKFSPDASVHDLLRAVSLLCLLAGGLLFVWVRSRERAVQPQLPPVKRFDRMDFSMGRRPPDDTSSEPPTDNPG